MLRKVYFGILVFFLFSIFSGNLLARDKSELYYLGEVNLEQPVAPVVRMLRAASADIISVEGRLITFGINSETRFNRIFREGFILRKIYADRSDIADKSIFKSRISALFSRLAAESKEARTNNSVSANAMRIDHIIRKKKKATSSLEGAKNTAEPAVTGIDAVLGEGGIISGTVTDSFAVGIGDIDVYVQDFSTGSYVASNYTDGSGDYEVVGLPTGTYKVEFYVDSYYANWYGLNYLSEWYNNKTSEASADSVSVTAGSTTSNIDAQLAAAGQITGRVTDPMGFGTLYVEIDVYDASTGYWMGWCESDSNGDYQFVGLPTGSYKVEFYVDSYYANWYGLNCLSEWYNNKTSKATADPVSVTAGSTTSNIDAQLAAGGQITGRVTDPSSVGIMDVDVYLYDSSGYFYSWTYTDSNGDYSIVSLETGNYYVEFYADPWYGINYTQEWYNNKTSEATADPVSVTAGSTTSNIDAQLALGGKITGTVTNFMGGFEDVWIDVYDSLTGWYMGYGYSDSTGYYEVWGLPTGSYNVNFWPWGYYYEEWYNDKSSEATADPVAVTAGATTSGIDARLTSMAPPLGGTIAGRVTNTLGTGLEGVDVYVYDATNGSWYSAYTETDGNGYYRLGPIEYGSYKVRFLAYPGWPFYYNYLEQWYNNKTSKAAADIISLNPAKEDFLGTWSGQGVYYRNSDTAAWVKMATSATQITAGDLDGDGTDDLIGIWPGQGGVWVRYSSTGSWARLSSTADWIATGDMNGDGIDDLIGTWTGQGVYYRNSVTTSWVKLATPATQVTAGDLDKDGTDDLIGIWPGQGGVWVKFSSNSRWVKLSNTAVWIASGDMNRDGIDDLVGTWTGQGVYYRNSETSSWIMMGSPAIQITVGDINGDGIDDLLGIWPGQGGVWVKYSVSGSWEQLSSTADWMACGKMRVTGASSTISTLSAPIGGIVRGPSFLDKHEDFLSYGPGGLKFKCTEEKNIKVGSEIDSERQSKITASPNEYGFTCIKQKNLVPIGKGIKEEKKKKK